MTIGLLFWVLMVFWLIGLFGRMSGASERYPWFGTANDVLAFILFFLLGWAQFGFIIHS